MVEYILRMSENRESKEYLDLRGKKLWKAGGDCIMRGFIITCTLYQMLLW